MSGKIKSGTKSSKPKRPVRSSKPKTGKTSASRGDIYTTKNIGSKATVVQGRNNTVTVTMQEGVSSGDLAALFQTVYQQIEARPPSEVADKEEIVQTVQRIESEVKEKGEKANETRLQRWMDGLNTMAPDIVDVILASLGGPVPAAAAVLKKIAERTRQPASG